jgi:hypothetical protein
VASKNGRGRRHTHRDKRPDSDGFTPYMSRKVCEACGKQCYLSREEAKRSARVNHPGQTMCEYPCTEPSGKVWWHLSSMPADKLRQLREREHGY